jgi:dipeptidyl aminopeptidase/acylaminoacyl peptidase
LGTPGGQADALTLAERGYAILRANPRGSGGYGKAFRFANQGDWGGGDYRDLIAGVDHLIAQGLADPDRLGVAGWSYGGFMTSWIITQTRRFKAACIGAPVTDPVSFNGTSDIPGFIPDYFGGESWDDSSAYERQSPIHHVRGVTTPALIQHGADDVRVPLGQGREFFSALRRQGVPAELVIYPRQGHGIGEPRLMLDVTRRAIAWFERWIPGGPG